VGGMSGRNKVRVEVHVYEIDGEDTGIDAAVLNVQSHWNHNGITGFVVLSHPSWPAPITVAKVDLEKAIDRCVNL
jgi:hypothetical protein